MPTTTMKEYHGIEILRFVCSLSVVVWHYQHFFADAMIAAYGRFSPEKQPFFNELFLFYTNGSFSVQVFWVISGFIFVKKYSTSIQQRQLKGFDFFILRFSRLYPLHFIILLYFWYYKRSI